MGPINLAVAGKDLLYQRRTRTRQADHENRREGGFRCAPIFLQEFRGKQLDDSIVSALGINRIVFLVLPSYCVAFCEMIERFVILLACFEFEAQRVMDLGTRLVGKILPLQQRLHGFDLMVFEAKCLQVGQAPVSFGVVRFYGDSPPVTRDRFLLLTNRFLVVCHATDCDSSVRGNVQRLLVGADRTLVVTRHTNGAGVYHVRLGVVRGQSQHLFGAVYSVVEFVILELDVNHIHPGARVVRRH